MKYKTETRLFLTHISKKDKPISFVFPGKAWGEVLFAALTNERMHAWSRRWDRYFGDKWDILTNENNVRSLITGNRCVYFVTSRIDSKEATEKIAINEGLSLEDIGEFTIKNITFTCFEQKKTR